MQINNSPYYGPREYFYYMVYSSLSMMREDSLGNLLDDDYKSKIVYYTTSIGISGNITDNFNFARLWKDSGSANRACYVKPHGFSVVKISRKEFLEKFEIIDNCRDTNYLKNLKHYYREKKFQNDWKEHLKLYKCISAYTRVDNPDHWMPCKNCNLIPLIWEFDNGKSTACGCGKNEYDHFSIHAESIMSHVSRNNGSALNYNIDELRTNWNNWVLTGIDSFKLKKMNNKNIW